MPDVPISTSSPVSFGRDMAATRPPVGMGAFEFVSLSRLRAVQLMRGCIPTLERNGHKLTVVAQMEVSAGLVPRAFEVTPTAAIDEPPLVAPA